MKEKSFVERGSMSVQDPHRAFVDKPLKKLKNPLSPGKGRGIG
jgi:hypothetical protein